MTDQGGTWVWRICALTCLIGILAALLGSGLLGFRLFQLEWKPQGETDLQLSEVALPFENRTDISAGTGSLPFMAGVVIDVDGDYRDEVLLGGGRGQPDGLMQYDAASGAFIDISPAHDLTKAESDATMGGTSMDIDSDGDSDLILARESGLYLFINTEGRLSGGRMALEIDPTTTPLSIAPGDINGDGLVDLYVSGYIRNDLVEGQTIFNRPYGGYSHLFLKTGPGAEDWRDASQDYGIWRQHNTFTALFADLDNDRDSDLIIAQDTGHVEMYRNPGTAPLEPIANPSVHAYPMGIAAGDLTGDGLIDLYFSNVGHTLPRRLLRGDLPSAAAFNPLYMLFENTGTMTFQDTAEGRRIARLGFGWGTVAADLNLDGWEDLIVAQNYAKFGQPAIIHRYSGKILQNYEGQLFRPIEKKVGAENRLFAITPLIGDFNGDSLPDLIWANLNGPSRAFLNTTPDRNVIEVRLDDTAASLNAIVTVTLADRTLTRQIIAGQGLASDQSAKLMIGLGTAEQAERVSLRFPDGRALSLDNVPAGTRINWQTGGE